MPKNLHGGNHKHLKKQIIDNEKVIKDLILADETNPTYAYGLVQKNLGSAVEVLCALNKTCKVALPKRPFIRVGDVILFDKTGLKNVANVVVRKYEPHEVSYLKTIGHLKFLDNKPDDKSEQNIEDDIGFNFDDI
jgi:hypothetical protein